MEEVPEVSDAEVRSLAEAILQRHGIDFTCYEPKSLKRRIVRTISMLGFKSIHELWVAMLRQPDFIHKFMDEISVGLTAMFRDPILWRTLKTQIPKLIQGKHSLNIWHAGCSSGEEVYTMGIVLKELGLACPAKALATDISQDALRIAKEGAYHKIKLIEYEKNYKEYNVYGSLNTYSQRDEHHAIFQKDLIKHVDFKYHNLITDNFPGQFDIIFCRNVMIYFDSIAKVRLMEKFHKALRPGGILVVGFYDAVVPVVNENLFEVSDMEAKIFAKKELVFM